MLLLSLSLPTTQGKISTSNENNFNEGLFPISFGIVICQIENVSYQDNIIYFDAVWLWVFSVSIPGGLSTISISNLPDLWLYFPWYKGFATQRFLCYWFFNCGWEPPGPHMYFNQ
jgi:hypothetical protein